MLQVYLLIKLNERVFKIFNKPRLFDADSKKKLLSTEGDGETMLASVAYQVIVVGDAKNKQ